MEQTKLQINTVAGILAIIGAIVFPISFWIIAAFAIGDAANILQGGNTVATPAVAWLFNIYALAGLAVFIVALIQSNKAKIKTTGHILGIIGNAYYLIIPFFRGLIAMVLLILAAVFTLKQERLPEGE